MSSSIYHAVNQYIWLNDITMTHSNSLCLHVLQYRTSELLMAGFGSLAPKTRNLVVAGGLSAFVLGVYYYTMRAVGGTDELQVAIDKFEEMKKKDAGNSSNAGS